MCDNLRQWIFQRYIPQNPKCRDPKTHKQYRYAVDNFAAVLGREPELSDLTDERLAELISWLLSNRGVAEITANERVGRIKSFWNWAAHKRIVEMFPTIGRVPVPEKIPRAWRRAELKRLFQSCQEAEGYIGSVPAAHYWFTLHCWFWCTAERISATLEVAPEHLDLDEGWASLPAKIRKGKRKPGVYALWPDLVELLRGMLPPHTPRRKLVFEWPLCQATFYNHYNRLLIRAGLPTDRDCKPHKMRVSHATWRHLAGGDATRALGHSTDATTRKSYLDPTLTRPDEPQLFRPWADDAA